MAKAVRLSDTKRWNIYVAFEKEIFQGEKDELKRRETELGMEIFHHLVPAPLLKKLDSLPRGWIRRQSTVDVQIAGQYRSIPVEDSLPDRLNGVLGSLDATHELAIKFDKLEQDKDGLSERGRQMNANMMQVLNSANTLKQLEEIWPEGEKFYAFLKTDTVPKQLVPVNAIQKINEAVAAHEIATDEAKEAA